MIGSVAVSCERGDEHSGSVNCVEFLDLMRNLQVLKKIRAAWSYLYTRKRRDSELAFIVCGSL